MRSKSFKPSKIRNEILKNIYIFRAMVPAQLMTAIKPEQYSMFNVYEMKLPHSNIYDHLKELHYQGLLLKRKLPLDHGNYYYLTKKGINLVKNDIMNIPSGKIGSGFDGNYSDFTLKHERPPKRIYKHLKLVDAILELKSIAAKDPSIQFDFRDNRYVMDTLIDSEINVARFSNFQPSGEIKINGIKYWIDVEEDKIHMNSKRKFQVYSQYLDYLSQQKEEIPKGILFMIGYRDDSLSVYRSSVVNHRFNEGMGKWSERFKLYISNLEKIEQIVTQHIVS